LKYMVFTVICNWWNSNHHR